MIPREENHKVSIIVVNWNGEGFLKDCLGALSGQSYGNREIILVDNSSVVTPSALPRRISPGSTNLHLKLWKPSPRRPSIGLDGGYLLHVM
jgi:GT2 family glycosyltransferase